MSVLINKWRRLVPLFQLSSHHQGQDLYLDPAPDPDLDIDRELVLDQDLELDPDPAPDLYPDPDIARDQDPAQHHDLDLFLSLIASHRSFRWLMCGYTKHLADSLHFQIQLR